MALTKTSEVLTNMVKKLFTKVLVRLDSLFYLIVNLFDILKI